LREKLSKKEFHFVNFLFVFYLTKWEKVSTKTFSLLIKKKLFVVNMDSDGFFGSEDASSKKLVSSNEQKND